jgi:hypothetical protein
MEENNEEDEMEIISGKDVCDASRQASHKKKCQQIAICNVVQTWTADTN